MTDITISVLSTLFGVAVLACAAMLSVKHDTEPSLADLAHRNRQMAYRSARKKRRLLLQTLVNRLGCKIEDLEHLLLTSTVYTLMLELEESRLNIDVTLPYPTPRLRVFSEHDLTALDKLWGTQDLVVESDEFDAFFVIQGDDLGWVKAILTNDIQDLINGVPSGPDKRNHIDVSLTAEGRLRLSIDWESRSADDVVEFVKRGEHLVTAIDQAIRKPWLSEAQSRNLDCKQTDAKDFWAVSGHFDGIHIVVALSEQTTTRVTATLPGARALWVCHSNQTPSFGSTSDADTPVAAAILHPSLTAAGADAHIVEQPEVQHALVTLIDAHPKSIVDGKAVRLVYDGWASTNVGVLIDQAVNVARLLGSNPAPTRG